MNKPKTVKTNKYLIINYGTIHAFNPEKRAIDYYTNQETTLLEIHKQQVLMANNRKKVYIMYYDTNNNKFVELKV